MWDVSSTKLVLGQHNNNSNKNNSCTAERKAVAVAVAVVGTAEESRRNRRETRSTTDVVWKASKLVSHVISFHEVGYRRITTGDIRI